MSRDRSETTGTHYICAFNQRALLGQSAEDATDDLADCEAQCQNRVPRARKAFDEWERVEHQHGMGYRSLGRTARQ